MLSGITCTAPGRSDIGGGAPATGWMSNHVGRLRSFSWSLVTGDLDLPLDSCISSPPGDLACVFLASGDSFLLLSLDLERERPRSDGNSETMTRIC